MLVDPTKWLKQIIQNKHNGVKNPKWLETNQKKKSQLQPKLRVLISQGVVNCLVRSAILRNSKWSTEAHIPTRWYGQDRTHAHNHITRAVAARDSYFALLGAHQHGIASTVSLAITNRAFCCRSGCINLTFVVSLRTTDVSPRSSPPRDVSRGGTSAIQRQKFHTDDAKSVRNPVRSANWSTE